MLGGGSLSFRVQSSCCEVACTFSIKVYSNTFYRFSNYIQKTFALMTVDWACLFCVDSKQVCLSSASADAELCSCAESEVVCIVIL